jgi:hypothetical protein
MQSEELRSIIEEALRYLIPLPIRKPAQGEAFLEIPGPKGAAIELFESDGEIELKFGVGGESFSFLDDEDDDAGSDGEPLAIVDAENPAFKAALKDLAKTVLDIAEEKVFSAQYKKLFLPLGGLFPAADFEKMRGYKRFVSRSWAGKFDQGGESD